ncbi:MAG: SDR family oxidoreductase [Dehalococcoidia bacterium]|nr:SDR family oxidoreductase [Dehalococcoidia bacterium]
MDLELAGKVAIVTGGNRGIGRAIALELAREGVDVAIAGRDETALAAATAAIAAETGRRVLGVRADTGRDDDVKELVARAVAELGGVDILVNNAANPAGGPVPPLEQLTEALSWDDMNVKVMGYLRCAREVAPLMKARGWGRIVNISGLAARTSNSAVSSMRNVAVAAMTKNLADELGPFGIGVTVVHPGLTRTEKTGALIAARAAAAGVTPEEMERGMVAGNAIRRIVDAREIGWIVAFLASPKAAAITGDAIVAGGGTGRAIHY